MFFDVAVIGADRALRRALKEHLPAQIRGRPLNFAFFVDADAPVGDFAAVFLDRRFRSLHDRLLAAPSAPLLIYDGRMPDENQLVGILTSGDRVTISLTRDNLIARGFEPTLALLEFAGTKADLADELQAMQKQLDGVLVG